MPTFEVSLVCPEALVFVGDADQVDLPGAEGDLGVLAGHVPIVTALRPGVVRVFAHGRDEKFVVLGGVAEFSEGRLNVLAESASPMSEFDVAELKVKIEDMERTVPTRSVGEELDRDIELLDHYKTLHRSITVTTAL
ncbi:MAG TPA: F0F1 ATP synthase subunit epsilon [Bradyrhizobium sp.]|jgi:F-type H+-transporting ATPase subunit epsilon|nr:F0F1 ATP synthase subunit epsilon [Bradyrhizobium sp.]